MFCENCGNKLNNEDKFCTNCGWKVPLEEEVIPNEEQNAGEQSAAQGQSETQVQPVTEEQNTVEKAVAEEQTTEETTVQEEQMVEESVVTEEKEVERATATEEVPVMETSATEEMATMEEQIQQNVPKKESKKLLVAGGIAAGVVAVAAVGICCFGKITNFAMKTFAPANKYYQYVEKKELAETAESISNIYQNVFLDNADFKDISYDGKLAFKMSDEGLEQLENLSDIALGIDDLSSMQSASLTFNTNTKDDMSSAGARLTLGKTDIISGETIFDTKKGTIYFKVPELYDKYIGVNIEDAFDVSYDSDEMEEIITSMEEVYDKCPDKKVVEKLLYKYFCTAVGYIDDVEKERTEIDAEDITQKCTQLKATINGKTLAKMTEAVLKQMKDDKELKKIIQDMASLADNGEDYYDEFQNAIEDALDDVDAIEDMNSKLILSTYVDGSGKIIGRQLKTRSDYEQLTIVYKMPEKAGKYGFELSMEENSTKMEFTGSGKRHGSKLDGEFTFKANREKVFEVEVADYDTAKIKEGYLHGNFIFKLKGGYLGKAAAIVSSYRLGLNVDTAANASKIAVTLYDGDDEWATVSADVKKGKGKKVSVPSGKNVKKIDDESDLIDLVGDFEFSKLKSNLKKAKVPSDILDELEDIEDYADDMESLFRSYGVDEFATEAEIW